MSKLQFLEKAWEQYVYWQTQDSRTLKKLNKLITDISRNGNTGIGHPEELKGNLAGWWSREIDEKNRLVYKIENDVIIVLRCKNHYDDK